MDFYQVAMTVAEIHGWPKTVLATKVGLEYNNIRNWARRKSTTSAEFESLWKGLGIGPSDLALAAALSDSMMASEMKAYERSSNAVASPAITWAMHRFGSLDDIKRAVDLGKNSLQRGYLQEAISARRSRAL